MDRLSYEEMERMYREAAESGSSPDLAFINIESARSIWGDEQVEMWIADGTIRFIDGNVVKIIRSNDADSQLPVL